MTRNLTHPPTESEIAALIRSLDAFPEHQMVARRMAFELDRIKEKVKYCGLTAQVRGCTKHALKKWMNWPIS